MTDDRAVSITVTHVMTIGITTILIAGLLLGAGNMLEDQRRSTGNQELRSIGDRHATEIVTATTSGLESNGNVTIHSRQPSSSVGGSYRVELTDRSSCFEESGYDGCLFLNASGRDIGVQVPIGVPSGVTVQDGSAQGGRVVIQYWTNDTVTIRGEDA
ncbi:hypothetical protein L593_13605 [Salinarchaeum sp. Harcht-Bsk1]|uniref:DUF7266 family protein n=1 Tax=Salinarchaeum sp. Harcht-Bsk1 TaxID=1333523 RepID=UPI0003422FAE|nr:hypothetical protein [Salinarchaeum sp. Harcht-Bsk1]AGN02660.1 hypothetical protein L593_13605 [Salinarchaeum sp. Harcht-Bsk1]